MKKILVAISLMLVASFLISIPAMGVVSTDEGENAVTYEELLNSGILGENDIHYVGKPATTAPVLDGVINKGEYSYSYRDTNGVNTAPDRYYPIETNEFTKAISEYVDVYFSYDDKYVYVGISDPGFYFDAIRHNKTPNIIPWIGIDKDDVNNGCKPKQIVGNTTPMTKAYVASGTTEPFNDMADIYIKKASNGDGGYSYVHEYRFNKVDTVSVFNALNDVNAVDRVEFPEVFGFTLMMAQFMGTSTTSTRDSNVMSYVRYIGRALTNTEKYTLGTDLWWIPAIVVLGEVPTADVETEEVTTEEVTTEEVTTEEVTTEAPATEAPTTEAPATEAPTTEAPVTEAPTTTEPAPAKKGCKGSIGMMGLALVATLGTCAVVVTKKKED